MLKAIERLVKVSLRTYPIIIHPAFLSFIEASRLQLELFKDTAPSRVPIHRPDIQNLSDVARYLGVSPFILRELILRKEKHYRSFHFKKRLGGTRQIDAPRTFLKVAQWWILDTILSSVESSPHSFGFVRGRSFVDNARFHVGSRYLLNVDVKDFFPSISRAAIEAVFRSMGYRETVSSQLSHLTTFHDTLPQGAPTSPSLANIFMLKADSDLNEVASRHGLKFSRYADDVTLSGQNRISLSVVGDVADVLLKYHLRLNEQKTRFMGINDRKEVTGLLLGETGVALSRETLNAARGWFHRIACNPAENLAHEARLRGTLALIGQVKGRGTEKVISLGHLALAAIERSKVA